MIKINFNRNWLFHDGEIETQRPETKGPVYTQAKTVRFRTGPASVAFNDSPDDYGNHSDELNHIRFEKISLPHDYIVTQEMSNKYNNATGFFDYHPAWYRKHFTVESGYARYVLYFEGATANTEIYLNGVLLYLNRGGYAPFEVDLSDFLNFEGDNVLAVHTVPQTNSDGWWYEGAGIFRNVWLEMTDEIAVDRYGVYVSPAHLGGDEKLWNVPVEVTVRNNGFETKTASVKVELVNSMGNSVAEMTGECEISPRDKAVLNLSAQVKNPELWNPNHPNLYTARTTVSFDGKKDETETVFGFRTLNYTADKGLFINGFPVYLNGVCGHGDFGLTGKAVPDNIIRYKVRLLKEMGANAYRCSHYPQSEEMMDEFDRRGIMVMDETRWFNSSPDEMEQLRTMVLRDRNHPGVIMWCVGNEEKLFADTQGKRIFKAMKAEILKLDSTRPVMAANSVTPDKSTVYDDSDIIGINYNLHIYDTVREQYPDKAFVSTECCATGTTRGWYYPESAENGYLPAYDRDTNSWFRGREYTWKALTSRPYVIGGFQWIAFEHRGETVWPRICSQSGAIDLFLQKKDAFYQNQSFWSRDPMVHILPHWNLSGREGEKIPVWAYSNCTDVELFVDGVSYGKVALNSCDHAEWEVEYRPAKLEVIGYICSERVAYDVVETTGKPVALRLRADNMPDVHAGRGDIALFTCYCVDGEGREVPDAAPYVRFNCNGLGQIIGTGSDVSDRNPVNIPARQMRAGAITVAVRVGDNAGKLVLYANSDGLDGTRIEIDITE